MRISPLSALRISQASDGSYTLQLNAPIDPVSQLKETDGAVSSGRRISNAGRCLRRRNPRFLSCRADHEAVLRRGYRPLRRPQCDPAWSYSSHLSATGVQSFCIHQEAKRVTQRLSGPSVDSWLGILQRSLTG